MQEIWDALAKRGHEEYGGELVTQLEHGVQAATLAEKEGAGDVLITAALLHDVGHMIDVPPGASIATIADKGIDACARGCRRRLPEALVRGRGALADPPPCRCETVSVSEEARIYG